MLEKVTKFNYEYQLNSLRLSIIIFIGVLYGYYYIIKYYMIYILSLISYPDILSFLNIEI